MSIILQNVDKGLSSIGQTNYKGMSDQLNIKECQGLFVDWISTKSNNAEKLVQQTEIIEDFVKNKKKILIFDRYRSMNSKEFNYLNRSNVTFWEPVLYSRKGFQYQPCWIDIPNTPEECYWNFNQTRKYDLGYKGSVNSKFRGISKYYEDMFSVMDLTISMDIVDIKEDQITELISKGVDVDRNQLNEYKIMVMLGKPEDYVSGYLDPIFVDCINHGIVPVLPYEHRWYHAMFEGLVIKKATDLKFIINLYPTIGFGMIYDLLKNIEKQHTEMTTPYVKSRIINHFK